MCKFWSLLTIVVMSCLLAHGEGADPDDPFDESWQAPPDAADGSLLRPEMQPPQKSKDTSPARVPAPASKPAPATGVSSAKRRPTPRPLPLVAGNAVPANAPAT